MFCENRSRVLLDAEISAIAANIQRCLTAAGTKVALSLIFYFLVLWVQTLYALVEDLPRLLFFTIGTNLKVVKGTFLF